ncbi:MAG: hypothetical protein ACRCWQ_07595 [Bacilli bacterium]
MSFAFCMLNHVSRNNAMKLAHRVAKFNKFCCATVSYAQHLKSALKRVYTMIKRAESATYIDTFTNRVFSLAEIVERVELMREVNAIITDKLNAFKIRVSMNNTTFDYDHDMNHEFCSYNIERIYQLTLESNAK